MGLKLKLIFMVTLVVACFTANAQAEGNLTVSPTVFTQSAFSASVTGSSVASINGAATLNGKLEIKAQQPKLQHQLKGHMEHGLWCRTGIAIWGASETSNGPVWIPKPGNHGKTHACLVHGVWRQILGPPSQWNCGNRIVWIHEKLPKGAVVFRGKFVIVTHFTYTVTVTATAEAKKEAAATATCTSADHLSVAAATVTGKGVATATATITASGSTQSEAQVKAESSAKAQLESTEKTTIEGKAEAKASVELQGQATVFCVSHTPNCSETGTCFPPTCEETHTCQHVTEISCTGFEEISGNSSFLVDCVVSDDNGAPISLKASANDGNSRVSGINCFSNGGTQTCPSGGTFEFRVSGINEGSSILKSSITAIASANGVNATFTSDQFPVDPSEGGF